MLPTSPCFLFISALNMVRFFTSFLSLYQWKFYLIMENTASKFLIQITYLVSHKILFIFHKSFKIECVTYCNPKSFTNNVKVYSQLPFFFLSPYDYSFFALNFSLLVIVLFYAVKSLHASFSNVPRSLSQLFSFLSGLRLGSTTHIICN